MSSTLPGIVSSFFLHPEIAFGESRGRNELNPDPMNSDDLFAFKLSAGQTRRQSVPVRSFTTISVMVADQVGWIESGSWHRPEPPASVPAQIAAVRNTW